jgi:N utilization substance protein A
MSQEIIEAVREIERDKGIEEGALVAALGALLAAYKKTPGASAMAVEMDDLGDFRVLDLAESAGSRRARAEARRARAARGRSEATPATPHLRRRPRRRQAEIPEDQIKREDVTPEASAASPRRRPSRSSCSIREEERRMMYDEYIDRVSEVVTGIVQQAGDRNNVLVDLGKVEALPRSSRSTASAEQGSRIKAVITEVAPGRRAAGDPVRRDPELIKTLFELEVPEIADGLVEIRGVAREPYRSKIAVTRPGRRPGRRVRQAEARASAWSSDSAARRSTSVEQRAARFVASALADPRPGLPRRRRQGGDGVVVATSSRSRSARKA